MTSVVTVDESQDAGNGSLKWVPKFWKPVYDQMIVMHIFGVKQTEIAEKLKRTTVNVCNVLSSPPAQAIINVLREKILKDAQENIADNISSSTVKAAQRLRDYMNDDRAFEKNPGAMADRALKILASMGHTKTGEGSGHGNVNVGNMFLLDEGAMDKMTVALEIAQKASVKFGQIGKGNVEGIYTKEA